MSGIVTKLNSEVGENVVIGTMNSAGTVIMVISDLSAIEIEAEVDETDIAAVYLGSGCQDFARCFPRYYFQGRVIEVGNSAQSSTGFSCHDRPGHQFPGEDSDRGRRAEHQAGHDRLGRYHHCLPR